MKIQLLVAKTIEKILFFVKLISVKKNKIIFCCYKGKNYSCNPKYITEYLLQHMKCEGIQIIWGLRNPHNLDSRIQIVKYPSIEFFFHFITASVIVTNSTNFPWIPKKESQLLINTWHGGGAYKSEYYDEELTHYKNRNVDYFLSSSNKFQEIMEGSTGLSQDKFLNIGMPRNDIMFSLTKGRKEDLLDKIGLSTKYNYVLYAPTYRDSGYDFQHPDMQEVVLALERRFGGKWKIIVRGHYNDSDEFQTIGKEKIYIDLSRYEDMQEVLCISDAVITDYSSLIWDYSFLYRPCFLYVPDLQVYEKERGFGTPIGTWGFPIAQNMNELLKEIEQFNLEDFKEKMRRHHENLGSTENGNATSKICELICKRLAYEE